MKSILNYHIKFPTEKDLSQDTEYICLTDKKTNEEVRIRLHDYAEIYKCEGLYESLFNDKLQCSSPEEICNTLKVFFDENSINANTITAFDLGAGSGLVGENLKRIGVNKVFGLDILEEAKLATERDRRPGTYEKYYVADLTQTPIMDLDGVTDENFNLMTVGSALGFGDIPVKVFIDTFNLIDSHSWVGLNIKDEFLSESDQSGFAKLFRAMIEKGVIRIHIKQPLRHRLTVLGKQLYYYIIIAEKRKNLPNSLVHSQTVGHIATET